MRCLSRKCRQERRPQTPYWSPKREWN